MTGRPESSFLRTLWAPLLADAEREVELALKVALGTHHGMKPDEIAARLGVTLGEVKGAAKRLAAARERLDISRGISQRGD